MEIYAIWIRDHGELWLHDAFDKINVDEHNDEPYKTALQAARDTYGEDNVRTQCLRLPYDKVEVLFETPTADVETS